jgi:hypothetical protein
VGWRWDTSCSLIIHADVCLVKCGALVNYIIGSDLNGFMIDESTIVSNW